MGRNWDALGLMALLALGGCSSEAADAADAADTPPPPRATTVATASSSPRATPTADSAAGMDSPGRVNEIEVMRETFAYQGSTRDPFNSLLTGQSTGPELADLQLVAVMEDVRRPSNSVVILREKVSLKRHSLKAGDRLGRMRLAQIRPREAVFTIQDLGYERQETLSMPKLEEATP